MSDYNAGQATQENQAHQKNVEAEIELTECPAKEVEPSVTERTIDDMRATLGRLKAISSRLISINYGLFGVGVEENKKVDNDIDGCFVEQRGRLSESIFDEIGDIGSAISKLEGL